MRVARPGALVDLDGTLVGGGRLLAGARDFLAAAGDRCVVVSNDAEHLPEEVATMLGALGAPVPADRIILAGTLGLDRLAASMPGARVLVAASPALEEHACRLGLRPGDCDVEAVFLGRDRRFDHARLGRVANAVRKGARLFVANPDLTHPDPDGGVVPETGALLAAVLACTGRVPYEVAGKPERHLFDAALARLGLGADEVLMFGDNPDTDGAGAARAGIAFRHVGPDRPLAPDLLHGPARRRAEAAG